MCQNQTWFQAKIMTGVDPNTKTSAAKTMQLFPGFVGERASLCLLYVPNSQGFFHISLPCLASLFADEAMSITCQQKQQLQPWYQGKIGSCSGGHFEQHDKQG